jgi:hypothetical protein
MNKSRLIVVAALLAATLTGCIIHTRTRPCRNECWWSHGRQICERRCY